MTFIYTQTNKENALLQNTTISKQADSILAKSVSAKRKQNLSLIAKCFMSQTNSKIIADN